MAYFAACAKVMSAPPLRKTRSLATSYCSGLPPSFLAAISWSFFFASIAAACAARDAGERKVLGRVPPHNIALLPRHTENFCARAMHVDHRFCSQVADPGLEGDAPIRFDDQKPVE